MAVRITQPHPNLVGWYKLDDNLATTQVLDSSGSGNHGTATANTNTMSTSGPFGNNSAMSFTLAVGNINLGSAGASLTTDFTISLWHKRLPGGTRCVLSRGADSCWEIMPPVGGGWVALRTNLSGWHTMGTLEFSLGIWVHGAWTFSNGLSKLYRNGVYVGGGNKVGETLVTIVDNTYIGGRFGNETNGYVSDVRIYSAALSANEIYAQYVAGIRRRV